MYRSAMVVVLALLVSGCAMVQSNVSRFHKMPPKGHGATFAILPLKDQQGSLEFEQYAGYVAQKLVQNGYQRVASVADATYAVSFTYAMAGSHTETYSVPIYGQTSPGGTTYHSGSLMSGYGGYSSYSGTSYTPPTYGVVGTSTGSRQVHTRVLNLSIVDMQKTTKENMHVVFEGKVISSGSSNNFSKVAQCLIDAMFKDFPGASGKTETVTADGSCMK